MKLTLYFVLLITFHCHAQLTGKVVKVSDGDTFTLLADKKQIRIRLHGIDCPEKGQDYYQVAKQFLSDQIFGKTVTVKKLKNDRYRRVVGIVTVSGIVVNEKLLEAGLAWHYKEYDNNEAWQKLEESARGKRLGIWSMKNPVPPWEYRKRK